MHPKLILTITLFVITLLILPNKVQASHIWGANISYVCTNDSIYTFTINYYWNCAGSPYPPCIGGIPCPSVAVSSSCTSNYFINFKFLAKFFILF